MQIVCVCVCVVYIIQVVCDMYNTHTTCMIYKLCVICTTHTQLV
jgi:hypothetical protein